MFTDENGNFIVGRRARARGDVEKEILKYCERKHLPFDIAFKQMWDEKLFTTALGAPYDLSVEENIDFELHRAFLFATRFDAQGSDLQRKFKKLLKVETGKELDSKKNDIEFTSGAQVCAAVDASLYRVYEYYKHDMSEKEKLDYLEQKNQVMLKVHMDVQRHNKNLEFLTSRMRAFTSKVIDPGHGRIVEVNLNGQENNVYDKKLNNVYVKLVRNYLNHNAFVLSKVKMLFIPAGACILFNLGLNCEHSKNCTKESQWHVFFHIGVFLVDHKI